MIKKILVLILLVASYWLLVTNCHAQDENITITTYYPSPYGVYNELRLHPHHPYTTACVSTQEGNMYYDNDPARPAHALRVCMCTNSDCSNYDWVDVGTGGGGLWKNVGTNLYTNDSNWNVGIGISDPRAKLHVWGDVRAGDSDNLVVRLSNEGVFVNGSGSATQPLYSMNVANTGMFQANSGIGFTVTGTERMRIDTNGNVGIGTTSPNHKLEIVGVETDLVYTSSTNTGVELRSSAANAAVYIDFTEGSTSTAVPDFNARIIYGGNLPDNRLAIWQGGSERLVILPNGNVGIGTVSPAYKLDVRGGTVAGAGAYVNTSWSGYKTDFRDVDPQDVLEKINELDIKSWVYKPDYVTDDPYRHISPFGEDFYTAFRLGKDEKVITSLDAAGVALVGIQGLSQKINNVENENDALKKEVEILKLELRDLRAKLNAGQ